MAETSGYSYIDQGSQTPQTEYLDLANRLPDSATDISSLGSPSNADAYRVLFRPVAVQYLGQRDTVGDKSSMFGQLALPTTQATSAPSPGWESSQAVELAAQHYHKTRSAFEHQTSADALDDLYDRVDCVLIRREFGVVEVLLHMAAQNELALVALVGLLTITLPWREELGMARDVLARHAACVAELEKGRDLAARLLEGLR